MPLKSYLDGFPNSVLLLDPFNQFPPISDDIQQTINRNMGWDDQAKLWRLLSVDSDGRLYVSTSPSKTNTANNSNVDVTIASTLLLSANPSRKQYIIVNTGTEPIYITFDATADLVSGIPIAVDGFYSDDVYTGAVSAISPLVTNNVRIAEF